MTKALNDLLVLEFAEGLAGSLCGKLLAELGAEVIKIEPPEGDRLRRLGPMKGAISYLFELANAGKKSVVIDLKDSAGRKDLLALAERADVLIESYPVGHMASLGLGYERLSAINTALIYCSITPYGQTGPLNSWAGNELTVEAMSGIMATTGFPEDPPTRAGVPIGEHAGALFAATGILAALNYRDSTGLGQAIDVSLYDILITYLTSFLPACFITGKAPGRMGNRAPLPAPWNSYQAADGLVVICTSEDSQFQRLCQLIGRPELAQDERFRTRADRRARVEELDRIIGQWTTTKTIEEAVRLLDGIGIPAGPIRTIDKLLNDEHTLARRLLLELEHPVAATMPTSGPLFKMSETGGEITAAAPLLGQHTRAVLEGIATRKKRSLVAKAEEPGRPTKALEGLRVLDLTRFTAGTYATRVLANLGAEVIKVEPLGGEAERTFHPMVNGLSYLFSLNNCDKKSITLDLRKNEGRELLKELVKRGDVLIENLGPGSLTSLGLGWETLREINPSLIYASIKGYGLEGPYSHRRGYDTVVQGMCGIMSLTGWLDGYPTKIGVSAADVMAATIASVPILAAWHYRRKTGRGQLIDLAMYDACAWISQSAWPVYFATGSPPSRIGNRHHYLAPYNSYQAQDGLVVIAVETEEQWRALASDAGLQDLLKDTRYDSMEKRVAVAGELDGIIGDWVIGKKASEVVEVCQKAGVPAAPVLEVHEMVNHPQTIAREMIIDIQHPDAGPMKLLGVPLKMSLTPPKVEIPPPKPGQHNDEIYPALLGLKADYIRQLKETEVI